MYRVLFCSGLLAPLFLPRTVAVNTSEGLDETLSRLMESLGVITLEKISPLLPRFLASFFDSDSCFLAPGTVFLYGPVFDSAILASVSEESLNPGSPVRSGG